MVKSEKYNHGQKETMGKSATGQTIRQPLYSTLGRTFNSGGKKIKMGLLQ